MDVLLCAACVTERREILILMTATEPSGERFELIQSHSSVGKSRFNLRVGKRLMKNQFVKIYANFALENLDNFGLKMSGRR